MELVLIALVGFIVVFGVMMLAFLFAKMRGKKEAAAFQRYAAQQFPDLPVPAELLVASQQSKGKPDIALLVADARREIVVLFDRGQEGMSHVAYPFSALSRADSANRIISRGMPPSRVFSYEQTLTVTFNDGRSIPYYLEFPSNKHGSDKAPGLVAALFAPWEAKLNAIVRENYGTSVRPPAERPAATSLPSAASAVAAAPPPPSPPTPAPVAAMWAADPYERFDWRFFDGWQWTDQVGTGGQVHTDPPVPTKPLQPAHH